MANVMLDTTVLIDVLRGRSGAATRVLELRALGDTPYTCAINVEEVVRGIRPREEDAVRRLIAGLLIAPLGRDEGERAGEWRRSFTRKGRTLSQSDCLVAAAAVGCGARLVTGNPKDFPMPDVLVEHWPVGDG